MKRSKGDMDSAAAGAFSLEDSADFDSSSLWLGGLRSSFFK